MGDDPRDANDLLVLLARAGAHHLAVMLADDLGVLGRQQVVIPLPVDLLGCRTKEPGGCLVVEDEAPLGVFRIDRRLAVLDDRVEQADPFAERLGYRSVA